MDYNPEWLSGGRLSATFFYINFRDEILAPQPRNYSALLTDPLIGPLVTYQNATDFAALASAYLNGRNGNVHRCAVPLTPGTGACPEAISHFGAIVDLRLRNLAFTRESGIDLTASDNFNVVGGRLTLSADAALLFTFDQQTSSTTPATDLLNQQYNPPEAKGARWRCLVKSRPYYLNVVQLSKCIRQHTLFASGDNTSQFNRRPKRQLSIRRRRERTSARLCGRLRSPKHLQLQSLPISTIQRC